MEKLSKYYFVLYSVAVLAAATLYSFFAGTYVQLIPVSIWVNVLVSACTLGASIWFLHRMNDYGMPRFVQFLLWMVWNLGAEIAIMDLVLAAGSFLGYLDSIWLRAFLLCLYALIFLLWEARDAKANALEEAQDKSITRSQSVSADPAVSATAPTPSIDRISVRTGNTLKIISCESLLYIKAEGDYVNLVTLEGRWLKEQTMKSLQESLPPAQFVRVHRSYLVNISAISRIERYGKQHLILLKNGDHIQISTTGYKNLRGVLQL